MASVVGSPTFLDTNILVYASIAELPFHLAALSAIQVTHSLKRFRHDLSTMMED